MSTDVIKNFQQLGAVLALQIELEQRQEDIHELRTEVAALNQLLRVEREQRASYAHSAMVLKNAIEAMRTAGGSEEFQIAFDRAKELASAI